MVFAIFFAKEEEEIWKGADVGGRQWTKTVKDELLQLRLWLCELFFFKQKHGFYWFPAELLYHSIPASCCFCQFSS